MKKMCLALFLLLGVSTHVVAMQSWEGLSGDDLDAFNEDMNNGAIGASYINLFNMLEEKRISNPANFSFEDRYRLAEARDTLEFLGLGYFKELCQMKKDFRKQRDPLSIIAASPKAKKRLFFSSSSSSSEDEGGLKFVDHTAIDIILMGSGSEEEECDYTSQDEAVMKAWSFKHLLEK